MGKGIFIENLIKNLILIILFIFLFNPLKEVFISLPKENYDNILTVTTLLIMAALFADYAFSYVTKDITKGSIRYFGHLITLLILFCTGVLLEVTVIVVNLENNKFVWPITLIAVVFYFSLILFDFWDLLKVKQ